MSLPPVTALDLLKKKVEEQKASTVSAPKDKAEDIAETDSPQRDEMEDKKEESNKPPSPVKQDTDSKGGEQAQKSQSGSGDHA